MVMVFDAEQLDDRE